MIKLTSKMAQEEEFLKEDAARRTAALRRQLAIDRQLDSSGTLGTREPEAFEPRAWSPEKAERLEQMRAEDAERDRRHEERLRLELDEAHDLQRQQVARRDEALVRLDAMEAEAFRLAQRATEDVDAVLLEATSLLSALQGLDAKTVDRACGGGTFLRWRGHMFSLGERIRAMRGAGHGNGSRTPAPLTEEIQTLLAIARAAS